MPRVEPEQRRRLLLGLLAPYPNSWLAIGCVILLGAFVILVLLAWKAFGV